MNRLWGWIDTESVRPYQGIVYGCCIVAGLQSLIQGALPGAVTQAMGPRFSVVWSVLLVVWPVATLTGVWLARHGIELGLWAQTGGDTGVSLTAAAYAIAIFKASWGLNASFAAWMAIAISLCAAVMVVRDIRRIRQFGQKVKRLESGGAD